MDVSFQDNGTGSTWKYLFTDLADPRTSKWFLMSNPLPLIGILTVYIIFVLKIGPYYMKHRKPFQLAQTIRIYDLFQVLFNTYLFYRGAQIWSRYNWNCQSVDYSNSPLAMGVAWDCYLYFLNKLLDLLDTIFFVARKKYNQVSFLNVYHHSIMPLLAWQVTKYIPGGHPTFPGFLNTFIHIILYFYYYLSSLGPSAQKYLWWKKYITIIQLLQFGLVFFHQSQLLYFECGIPKWLIYMVLPNAILFFYLFYDFYKQCYNTTNTDGKHHKTGKSQ